MINRILNEATILIVDDSGIARRKIRQVLEEAGFQNVHDVSGGSEALERVKEITPDLFLLDQLMPMMDGLELCRRLKAMPRFADAAVLFVTGSTDLEPHWKSFEQGAVDYIPKPFHPLELIARVKTHLRLLFHMRANREYAEEMETLAAERARQLVHADRLSTLGVLAAGIMHEIKNPLNVISGDAQILQRVLPEAEKAVTYALANGYTPSPALAVEESLLAECLAGIRNGLERTLEIIEDIRTFSRRGTLENARSRLADVIDQALVIARNRLKYTMTVEAEIPADLPPIRGSAGPLSQVFINLLLNAADAVEGAGRKEGTIRIAAQAEGEWVRCTVADDGPGMDAETAAHIFDPFYTTKDVQSGTGLGLSISRQIVEDAGGILKVHSQEGEGTVFTLRLRNALHPAAEEDDDSADASDANLSCA